MPQMCGDFFRIEQSIINLISINKTELQTQGSVSKYCRGGGRCGVTAWVRTNCRVLLQKETTKTDNLKGCPKFSAKERIISKIPCMPFLKKVFGGIDFS